MEKTGSNYARDRARRARRHLRGERMDRDSAHTLATQVMADPQRMLKEQVQEELKIGELSMSP